MDFVPMIVLLILSITSISQSCDLELTNQCNCSFDQSLNAYNVSCRPLDDGNIAFAAILLQSNRTQEIKVHHLDLSSNQISTIPANLFLGISSIFILDLSNNSLNEIPKITQSLMISELQLAHNKFTEIDITSLLPFTDLAVLDLSNNEINQIRGNIAKNNSTNIHTINLSYNRFVTLDPSVLHSLKNTLSLDLSHNRITEITNLFPRLKTRTLNLSFNFLTNLPAGCLQELGKLQGLDISGNRFQHVQSTWFIGLESLEKLNLSNNNISSLDKKVLINVPQLRTLDISHNQLSKLSSEEFSGRGYIVKTLDLSFNNIGEINKRSFNHLGHMTSLLLSGNKNLSSLYDVALPRHLAYLDLTNCSVTELFECDIKPLVDLQFLHLQGNELTCDCHMKWLVDWSRLSMDSRLKEETTSEQPWMCKDGDKLVNFHNYPSEKFTCPDTTHQNRYCTSGVPEFSGLIGSNSSIVPTSEDIDLTMNSTTDGETIVSKWSVDPSHKIYGFKFTFSGSEEGLIVSPWLHGSQREYEMNDILSYTNYNVCVSAYHNETLVIATQCDMLYVISNKVYVGIMAGTVAIVPCFIALAIVIFKDRYAQKYEMIENPKLTPIERQFSLGNQGLVVASSSGLVSKTEKPILHQSISKPSEISSRDVESYINQSFAFADEASYKSNPSLQVGVRAGGCVAVSHDQSLPLPPAPIAANLQCCDEQHDAALSTKL